MVSKTQQKNQNLIVMESLYLTMISLFLTALTNTALLPIVASQGTVQQYFLTNCGLVACSSTALTLPLIIFKKQKKKPVLSGLGFSREKIIVRTCIGALAGLPIAGGWLLSFIVQHKSLPTLVNTASIAGFQVELTTPFILVYILYLLVTQGMVSISEEVLWRGFLQTNLQQGIGDVKGYLFVSFFFAFMHITSTRYSMVQVLMEALPGGLIVGYLYTKTKTITSSIFAHWVGNTVGRVIQIFTSF